MTFGMLLTFYATVCFFALTTISYAFVFYVIQKQHETLMKLEGRHDLRQS